jgi:hypothetical protein
MSLPSAESLIASRDAGFQKRRGHMDQLLWLMENDQRKIDTTMREVARVKALNPSQASIDMWKRVTECLRRDEEKRQIRIEQQQAMFEYLS